MRNESNISIKNIQNFVINWNNRFTVDHWWRSKYSIPFNSPRHRQACFIDIKIEYEEEMEIKRYFIISEKRKEDLENYQITGQFLNKPQGERLTDEQWDEIYNNLDVSKFNKDGRKD